ncbi:AAA family ATPase [uncultured Chryseobacterium sp.]|uniref:AAA family ATPase n=1 Tax=uncultured Chryseobacterium sp. TaxID=259322 RepID=UPI0025E3471F|nr:AAA family ATPase [uncultured Chryseobacterium sp.]
MNFWKLGCRWYSGAPLFFKYLLDNKIVISWSDKEFNINDNVLLTDGYTAIGVAKVLSAPTSIVELLQFHDSFRKLEIPTTERDLIVFKADVFELEKSEQFAYQLQQGICQIQASDIQIKTQELLQNKLSATVMENLNNLLTYKKQIILQGPPGTGKTRLAKQIAKGILKESQNKIPPEEINSEIIDQILVPGLEFKSVGGRETYKIKSATDKNFSIQTSGVDRSPSKEGIKNFYKNNLKWNTSSLSGVESYEMAMAKHIFENFDGYSSFVKLEENDQFKLIQFHPSYTYEDFVRGIVAESNGEKIEYKNVNKTLGLFAEKALKNFENSKKIPELISKELWIQEQYVKFKEYLESELEKSGELLIKNDTKPKITAIEVDAIRVNRYSNESDSVLIKDNDIINGYFGLHLSETIVKVKDNSVLSKSARSGMYYLYQNLIEKFREYLDKQNLSYHPTEDAKAEELKNYVLIIDEINRANLSSVLGELIYALEYRGEEVESMYSVDDSLLKNKLILPPNLFIIGTMNTADRSVGHIDYAIRRRFAFVDILPKNLTTELGTDFKKDIFTKVSELFIENYNPEMEYGPEESRLSRSRHLSEEFEPKDVWLGHSYFIQHYEHDANGIKDVNQPINFILRLEYEIKPILREYVKDGILKPGALEIIENLGK